MKKIVKIFAVLILGNNTYGQIGVGIETPVNSSALDVTSVNKGVLIPRVTLSSLTSKSPLTGDIPDGTLVFNTATVGTSVVPGVYVWSDNKWATPRAKEKEKGRVFQVTSNTSGMGNTNLNPPNISTSSTFAFFHIPSIFNDTDMAEIQDTGSILIKEAGMYEVSYNLSLRQVPQIVQSRVLFYTYVELDGEAAAAGIPVRCVQYNPSTEVNISGRFTQTQTITVYIPENTVLRIRASRYKNGTLYDGNIYMEGSANTYAQADTISSITLTKHY